MKQRKKAMGIRKFAVLAFAGICLLSFSSSASAEANFKPRGWDKGEKKGWEGKEHPPGWEKGKKKGWKKKQADHPPGWDKGKKSE